MAASLPVILVIDGVIRQVVEAAGGGVFVQPGNPGALAASIRDLARHPDLARRMGQVGCRYIRTNFNRQNTATKFEELLERLR
jgi:glycosyltransferase involved in cell wall biosynthesis